MSRDYLPFETHLEKTKTVTSKQKKGPLTPQPSTSEEDSEDEYDLDYEPVPTSAPPSIPKEGASSEKEHENMPRPVRTPVTIPTEPPQGDHSGQPITPVADQTDVEIALPAENRHENCQPDVSPLLTAPIEPVDHPHQRPRRNRYPPKHFTYDQLGTPSCYSI